VSSSRDFSATQCRLIRSESIATMVARKLDLRSERGFAGMDAEAAGGELLERLTVRPHEETRLVRVSYTGSDPALVPRIANCVVEAYKEANDARARERIGAELAALKEDLPRLREQLRKAEEERLAFQEKHMIASADKKLEIMHARMIELSTALMEVSQLRIQAQLEYDQVRAAGDDVGRLLMLPVISESPSIVSLRAEQLKLHQQRIGLLEDRGLRSPDLLAVDAKLDDIERRIHGKVREIVAQKEISNRAVGLRLEEVRKLYDEQGAEAMALSRTLAKHETLVGRAKSIREQYDPIVKLLNQTGASHPRATTSVHLVEPAKVPARKVGPNLGVNLILGGLLGLLLAAALTALVEVLDDSVKSTEDLAQFAKIPALGVIPYVKGSRANGGRGRDLTCQSSPDSSASESFRLFKASLSLSTPSNGSIAYLMTSALPSEGKTFVSVNAAIVMAHGDRKVLLIDADLRRSQIHHSLGLANEAGLTDLLSGSSTLDQVIQNTQVENLDAVTSGPRVPNPAESLDSARMAEVIEEAKRRYDIVIIDSSPVIPVVDSLILAQKVDGVLQIIRASKTSRKAVKRAGELLDPAAAPLLGAVLNNVRVDRGGYYDSYYGGYYDGHRSS